MKKLIAALTLLLAFTINANAQDKKGATPQELAKKEAADLKAYLGLGDTQSEDFYRLFEQKHRELAEITSAERKRELSNVIDAKIRASLEPKQIEKLEKNPELYKRLIN